VEYLFFLCDNKFLTVSQYLDTMMQFWFEIIRMQDEETLREWIRKWNELKAFENVTFQSVLGTLLECVTVLKNSSAAPARKLLTELYSAKKILRRAQTIPQFIDSSNLIEELKNIKPSFGEINKLWGLYYHNGNALIIRKNC